MPQMPPIEHMDEVEDLYRKLKDQAKLTNRRIKGRVHPVGFSKYLFGERKKIDRWNRPVQLVKFGVFGLTTKTKRDFYSRLNDLFLKNALPLFRTAENALEDGWKWQSLSVKEYNVIVFYVDFCNKILAIGEKRLWSDHEFGVVEEAFLKLALTKEHAELLASGLRKVIASRYGSDSAAKTKANAALGKLVLFLDTEGRHPALLDFVLAHNMVESRRRLTFGDLVVPPSGRYLPEKFYNCSIDVFRSILSHYRQLAREIKSLRVRLNWLEWLDRQSQYGGGDEPAEIMAFYRSASTDWLVDSKSFYLLVLTLVKKVIDQLDQIVRQSWELMTAEEKIIRARIVRDGSLEQMLDKLADEHAAGEAYRRVALPTSFALAEFLAGSVNEAIAKTKVYRELTEKLESMLSLLYKMAVTLEEISVARDHPGTSLLRHMIVRPIQYRGKSVMDLISGQTSLLLQICRFFRAGELEKELNVAVKAKEQLSAKQREMSHLDAGRIVEGLIAETGHDGISGG
jgi:hypothetical protein